MNDWNLLREYVEKGSMSAFDTIVRQHSPMVRATCARLLGENKADVDDVAQSVFIVLIKKAPKLTSKTSIGGWLYKTAILAVREHRRKVAIRKKREEIVVDMAQLEKEETHVAQWLEIKPLIDDAIGTLSNHQVAAVVARFLENQSWSDVGQTCGCGADTARKRCRKALEKIRGFLKKRGVVCSRIVLAGVLSQHSLEAGEGFTLTTLSPAINSLNASSDGVVLFNSAKIAQEIVVVMFWKNVINIGLSVLVVLIASTLCLTTNLVFGGMTKERSILQKKQVKTKIASIGGLRRKKRDNSDKALAKLFADYDEFKSIWEKVERLKGKKAVFSGLRRLKIPISQDEFDQFMKKKFGNRPTILSRVVSKYIYEKPGEMLVWAARVPMPKDYDLLLDINMSAREPYDVIFKLVAKSFRLDMPRTEKVLSEFGLLERDNYQILLKFHKNFDPESILDRLKSKGKIDGENKNNLICIRQIKRIIQKWSEREPEKAINWVDGEIDASSSGRETYLRVILPHLMVHDLPLAESYLKGLSNSSRKAVLAHYAYMRLPEDPESVLAILESYQQKLNPMMFSNWTKKNPREAAEFILTLEMPKQEKKKFFKWVFKIWSRKNRQEASEWFETLPGDFAEMFPGARKECSKSEVRFTKKDWERAKNQYYDNGDLAPLKKAARKLLGSNLRFKALELFSEIVDENRRQVLLDAFFRHWIKRKPSEFSRYASDKMLELNDKQKTLLANSLCASDFYEAMRWFESLPTNQKSVELIIPFSTRLAGNPEKPMIFYRHARNEPKIEVNKSGDPDQAMDFIDRNLDGSDREVARFRTINEMLRMAMIYRDKYHIKPERLAQLFLSTRPVNETNEYSAMLYMLLNYWISRDSEAALKWTENLNFDEEESHDFGSEAVEIVLKAMISKDPVRARTLIKNNPKLSPDQRRSLFAELDKRN